MLIIPAIDLKDGACVRLAQGAMDRATTYGDNPADMARRWESLGARRLHVVDLDGAMSGTPRNLRAVEQIRAAISIPIELGGGIRDRATVAQYLGMGIDYVILGTAALRDPDFLQDCCERFPGNIIVGIDARDGMVSVRGWTENTATRAIDFAATLSPEAVAAIIFTDISRDGMLTGPNIDSTLELARAVPVPVIASGGVSGIDDIRRLHNVAAEIAGVIVGRALYTGDLDLAACLRECQ